MMKSVDCYYNNFYDQLSKIDAENSDYSKISDFLPKLPKHSKILDIGCGYGTVSQKLVNLGMDVYAIEINKKALQALNKKGFKTINHDITEKIPLRDGFFDVVLLLDILEHVFNPLQVLEEAYRLLKKGGFVVITVPLYFDIVDRLRILFTGNIISYDNLCYGRKLYSKFRSYNYDHIRFFRSKDVFEMISISRFKVDRINYMPIGGRVISKIFGLFISLFANNYSSKMFPNLFAHSLKIRAVK